MSGQILQAVYFNNRVLDYFNCLAIFLGGVIIISLFRIIILRRMKRLVKKTDTTLDDFLVRII
ncbi:MAG: hypothetical protein KJ838_03465, partial [Candidatus Omnitrophica bacterium]|nr:hypothetical protein [Candidatus Omnitrophota bacterium]